MKVSDTSSTGAPRQAPCAFFCHASEDKPLARRIAQELQAHGIETFFDEWEIGPGDSIRRKIDDGLERCTHFVALLTPNSLAKSWVNAEMDAGFVRKVEGHAKFIALRYQVSARDLPPLLRGLHSPSVDDPDGDLPSLVSAIHGITNKPPLGPAPSAVRGNGPLSCCGGDCAALFGSIRAWTCGTGDRRRGPEGGDRDAG